jgi:hypothetical protein
VRSDWLDSDTPLALNIPWAPATVGCPGDPEHQLTDVASPWRQQPPTLGWITHRSRAERDQEQTGKIIRTYRNAVAYMLNESGGVRAFGGDHVMAVFIGRQDSSAAKLCYRSIGAVHEDHRRQVAYFRRGPPRHWHRNGFAMLTRGGVRRIDNDIVSIGWTPHVAVKLSGIANLRTSALRRRLQPPNEKPARQH